MVTKIEWIPPEDSDVGSVLIYRATDNFQDNVGSRSVIDTIGAKDGNGNWVLSYTDTGGDEDNVYRIQFWDGTGSSNLSDPITFDYKDLLADFDEVRRAARIPNNADIGSDEIYDSIQDATDIIWSEYGDPIKKTVCYIDASGSPIYDFTGDNAPVYQVRKVIVGNSMNELVPTGSYTVNLRDGNIEFTSSLLNDKKGENLWIEWMPKTINTLCKNLAALQLVEAAKILDGRLVETPESNRLTRIIDVVKEGLRRKDVTSDYIELERLMSLGGGLGHTADYVAQRIDRAALSRRE
jgi:hypothetical protein